MGNNSPADVLSDDDDDNGGNLHISNGDDDDVDGNQQSPHRSSTSDYNNNQTTNQMNGFSPRLQTKLHHRIDDGSPTTVIKIEQENEFNCSSPSPPSIQTLTNKNSHASSSAASKRLTGTLNRLLHSAINRPNGHHYNSLLNGVSSSPPASSSSATIFNDSTSKEPKNSLETNTQAIESKILSMKINANRTVFRSFVAFLQHFESSSNTMVYFQEKLTQLLVSLARKSIVLHFDLEFFFFLSI